MKKIIILTLLTAIFSTTIYAQEILNLNCINTATQKIAKNEIHKIVNFTNENEKILVLPFYSKNDIFTEVSISITTELTNALQQEIQKTNKNLTFFYPDEYNKQGNKVLQKYHLTRTENVNQYWKGIIERFNPDYYLEGYYFIEKQQDGKYFITLKNIYLKPNDLNNETGLKKLSLNEIRIEITNQDEINTLNKTENKNTFIFLQIEETIFDQTTQTIKRELRTQINKAGFTVESLQENATYKITIQATTREHNNSYGTFFSYADAYVEIINTKTNKTILQKDYTEKGGSTVSYNDAGQKAFKNIANKISDEIINKITEVSDFLNR